MKKQNITTPAGIVAGAAVAVIAILSGCMTPSGSMPMAEELAGPAAMLANSDLDGLRRGRVLAITECAKCHRQYWPNEYAPESWPSIVRDMGARASMNQGQVGDLEKYFVVASHVQREMAAQNPGE